MKSCLELSLSFTLPLLLLKHTTHCLTVLTSTDWSLWTFWALLNVNRSNVFIMEEFNYIPVSTTLHCDTSFFSDCLSTSVCQVKTKFSWYWQKGSDCTAIQPKSTSEVVGQHNEIWTITFGAPLIYSVLCVRRITYDK